MSSPSEISWARLERLLKVLAESLLQRIPELRRRVGASDLVQETRIKAEEAWGQLQDRSPNGVTVWLRKILRNQFKDAVKEALRDCRNLDLEKSIDQEIDNSSLRLDKFLEDRAADGLAAALDLASALEKLSPEDRALVIAHDLDGKSLRDMEREFGIPRNTLATRLARAHAQLRRWLSDYDPNPPEEPAP